MRTAEDTADIKIPFKAVLSLNSKHQLEKVDRNSGIVRKITAKIRRLK